MFCIHCGAALDPEGKYCGACGKPANGVLKQEGGAESPFSPPAVTEAPQPVPVSLASLGAGMTEGVPQIRPWVRYWARIIDIIFWAFPGGLLLGLFAPHFVTNPDPGQDYLVGIVVMFMWVFVEPLCLVVFGTTPGKSLLRIRLVYTGADKLSYGTALARSMKVWWRGLAAGVPLISLFTLITAYQRLQRNHRTSWDAEGGFVVQHGRIGAVRVIVTVVLIFLYFFVLAALGALES